MQPLEPEDPLAVGEYRLLRRLGAGGMGRVYLARSASGRTVAVKVVHPHFSVDEQFRTRFRREVAAAQRVGGDWTAPVLDADPDAKVPWVVTGYVAGPTLTQAVTEHGPLPERSVRVLGAGLAEALHHVHGLGLVHRDVKPSNVLLTVDGPRLIDFGIARATDGTASLTATGVSIGSPGYMSPEQVLGKGVGAASDIFSLGAVLAYAARSEAPFPGDNSAALLYKVVHEDPELEGVEGELRELIASTLAKDAADRPGPLRLVELLTGAATGGAGELVGAGWLPAPVVEQAGRSAVAVLGLEPERTGGADASGPVPFTSFSGGTGLGGAAAAAQVRPPPPGYPPGQLPARTGPGAQDGIHAQPQQLPGAGQQVPRQTGFGPPDPSYGSHTFPLGGSPDPGGEGTASPDGGGAGGPAEADDAAGGGRRGFQAVFRGSKGRRGPSCVVAVTLSAAFIALGGVLFPVFLLDRDSGDGASQPPADTVDPPGKVSEDFRGVWEGTARGRSGIADGMFRITIGEGGKGDEAVAVVRDLSAGDQRVKCRAGATLDKVTEKQLTATEKPKHEPPEILGLKVCAEKPTRTTYKLLEDGRLRYRSVSEEARLTAELTRTGS